MSVRSLFLYMYDCYCSEDAILRCYDASARPSPRGSEMEIPAGGVTRISTIRVQKDSYPIVRGIIGSSSVKIRWLSSTPLGGRVPVNRDTPNCVRWRRSSAGHKPEALGKFA